MMNEECSGLADRSDILFAVGVSLFLLGLGAVHPLLVPAGVGGLIVLLVALRSKWVS